MLVATLEKILVLVCNTSFLDRHYHNSFLARFNFSVDDDDNNDNDNDDDACTSNVSFSHSGSNFPHGSDDNN